MRSPQPTAVGASRQYSGALGGIGLCQVAVHLTYAAESGHALIDRAFYLAQDWAGDDERRELAHVPGELCFATKPQLAAMLLERARDLGLPAPVGGRRRGLLRARPALADARAGL
jgi:SRSO17 transposase